jgi:hypothetical protein
MGRDPYNPFIEWGPFTGGTNNLDNAKALSKEFIRHGYNADLDNTGYAWRRPGCGAAVVSGASKYGWSNRAGTLALFVQGTILYCLNEDGTKKALRTGLIAGLPMSYTEVNDRVYYSNNQVIGYVKDFQSFDLATPTKAYKSIMLPGEIIRFYNLRLYTIRGGLIRWSDSGEFNSTDKRRNFKMVPGRVTLFEPVKGGIYMSFAGKTVFAQGLHLEQSEPIPLEAAEAIPYSSENVARFKAGDGTGNDIRWLSAAGLCRGLDGGVFTNISSMKYLMPSNILSGAPLYRESPKGFAQYLCNLTIKA